MLHLIKNILASTLFLALGYGSLVNENRFRSYHHETYSSNVGDRYKSNNHINKCKIVVGTTALEEATFILREHEEGPLMRPGRSGKALELKDRRYTIEEGLEECSRQRKQHA